MSGDVTQLLLASREGNGEALERILPLVYEELRSMADRRMRREAGGHTLQPTALVNEAYLCLAAQKHVSWRNRSHFLAIAAQTMRHILVDHARMRAAAKRGGDRHRITLVDGLIATGGPDVDLLALDDALEGLARLDPAKARLVELRFFGGLTIDESADVLSVSPATIKRMWSLAQAWLYRELKGSGST